MYIYIDMCMNVCVHRKYKPFYISIAVFAILHSFAGWCVACHCVLVAFFHITFRFVSACCSILFFFLLITRIVVFFCCFWCHLYCYFVIFSFCGSFKNSISFNAPNNDTATTAITTIADMNCRKRRKTKQLAARTK